MLFCSDEALIVCFAIFDLRLVKKIKLHQISQICKFKKHSGLEYSVEQLAERNKTLR